MSCSVMFCSPTPELFRTRSAGRHRSAWGPVSGCPGAPEPPLGSSSPRRCAEHVAGLQGRCRWWWWWWWWADLEVVVVVGGFGMERKMVEELILILTDSFYLNWWGSCMIQANLDAFVFGLGHFRRPVSLVRPTPPASSGV